MRVRVVTALLTAALGAALVTGLPAGPQRAAASTPASSKVSVPSTIGSNRATWTGTVLPGANPTNQCTLPTDNVTGDRHAVTLTVPQLPATLTYQVNFEVTWADATRDLILTVVDSRGTPRGSSDGGNPKETVVVEGLEAGTYTAVVCPFASAAPVNYNGVVSATTLRSKLPDAVDSRGLKFSAAVPADIQRDEGEPLIEIDKAGRVYTCGPTGSSQAEDYAQVSTDGGDQFHLLGEPPRGQQSAGGGGDCALATSPERNSEGYYQLSYVGLSGLLEFATATSPDGGHTFVANPMSRVGPAVDRQWTVATSTNKVFLNFNRAQPRQIEVCESNDAGLTYPDCKVVGPQSLFPGPMRSIPGRLNPVNPGQPIVYFPWTQATTVLLAVSMDNGKTWNNCLAARSQGQPGVQFPVADHDVRGNIYVVYGDEADFNTRMVTLRRGELANCKGGTTDLKKFQANPGFSKPVVVNAKPLRTTVFPWIAASAQPGRVGVSFYGSQTDGRADAPSPKTWNVYVNQSLNALSADARFSQVKATTHPNHYDQVCLLGLACTTGGDRSLVDFFAIEYNPRNGEYVVVFNTAHKRPGDEVGTVATPMVFRQIAGPSNNGDRVANRGRQVLRRRSDDPLRDAKADYSSLIVPPETTNVPAADLQKVKIEPAIDPLTGKPYPGGGFTVTLTVDDLSDDALQEGLLRAQSPSLLYLFRFVDGYRYAAVQANYDPLRGFTFGYSGYGATPSECGTPSTGQSVDDQCLTYYGDVDIPGAVNQATGEIRLTVPLGMLKALTGSQAAGQRPREVQAKPGDRIYSAAAFSQSNFMSPDDRVQSFLYPLDNTPAMDFRIPTRATKSKTGTGFTGEGTGAVTGAGRGGPGSGSGSAGGGGDGSDLPNTGGEALAMVAGFLLLGAGAWIGLRRRS